MTIASHSRAYQATRPVGSGLCDWRRKDCHVRKFLWTGLSADRNFLGNICILFSSTWTASLSRVVVLCTVAAVPYRTVTVTISHACIRRQPTRCPHRRGRSAVAFVVVLYYRSGAGHRPTRGIRGGGLTAVGRSRLLGGRVNIPSPNDTRSTAYIDSTGHGPVLPHIHGPLIRVKIIC